MDDESPLETSRDEPEQLIYKAVTAYEDAFLRGDDPDFTAYLPTDPGLRLAVLPRLIASDIELRWNAGSIGPDCLETYLDRFPELRADTVAVADLSSRIQELVAGSDTASRTRHRTHPPALGSATKQPGAISGYEVLGELGAGGMGVVLKALQMPLKRVVALKTVLHGARTDRSDLIRFLAEAEAVAAVKHPNVVQVFEYGEREGLPFMALEFLSGGTLAGRLKAGGLSPEAAAALVAKLARGVAAAHALGIVHRDLKPANVMFDDEGEPKVTDFGLAKMTGSDLTATQVRMGTPAYMSPEQARGETKFVGPQADVWALGVILYEALTGQRPFVAERIDDLLARIRTADPVPPRKHDPAVARDLELICLKCLAKQPHERYPTAKELADDLDRFARREPISVRPAGVFERSRKWVQRNPEAALALCLLVALAFGSAWFGVTKYSDNNTISAANSELEHKNGALEVKQTELAQSNRDLGKKTTDLEVQLDENVRQFARVKAVEADERTNAGNPAAALPFLADGLATLDKQRVRDADLERTLRMKFASIAVLTPKPIRVWVQSDAVIHTEFASDGRRVLTVCRDGTAQVLNVATGAVVGKPLKPQTPITRAAISPDGALVVTGGRDGRVRIWNAATGDPVSPPLVLGVPVLHVTFSPNGRHVLAAGGQLYGASTPQKVGAATIYVPPDAFAQVWDVPTEPGGAFKATKRFGASGWINHAAFAPSGKEIALASATDTIADEQVVCLRRLDAKPNEDPITFEHLHGVLRVAYSPDGKRVVAACGGVNGDRAEAVIWDTATKKRVGQPLAHDEAVTRASFNNDGSLVLTGSDDGTARIWDAKTTQPVSPPLAHQDRITAASFSPDGRLVLTAGRDGMVRLWHGTVFNEKAGELTLPPLPHGSPVLSATFSADGTRIITSCENGVIRVWDIASAVAGTPTYAHEGKVTYATVISDDSLVTATGDDGTLIFSGGGLGAALVQVWSKNIHLWDRKNQTKPQRTTDHTGAVGTGLVSPAADRASVALGSPAKQIWKYEFWSFANGERRGLNIAKGNPTALWGGFTSTGRHLVVTVATEGPKGKTISAVSVTDGDTGARIAGPLQHPASVHKVVVSADGSTLVTVSSPAAAFSPVLAAEATVRVWDIKTGQPRGEHRTPHQLFDRVFLSPSGGYLATVHHAETKIHRVGSNDPPVALPARDVFHVAFSDDEKLVVTASADQTARVWTVSNGQPRGVPLEHRGWVTFATFSRCGRYVATTSHDKTARVWDSQTGQPLTPSLLHRGAVVCASFAPDNVRLVTASHDGTARVWEVLSVEDRPVAELALIAEVLTGHKPGAVGGTSPSTPQSYLAAWRQLHAAYPKEYAPR